MEKVRFWAKDMIPLIKAMAPSVHGGRCLKGRLLVNMLIDSEPVELEHWFHLAMCPDCMELYDEMVEAGVRDAMRDRLSVARECEAAKEAMTPNSPELPVDAMVGKKMSDKERLNIGEKDWVIRTPSGMTFKFSCSEGVFGWRNKLAQYEWLRVSLGGEKWVDFAAFIAQFGENGDAKAVFDALPAVLEA